VAEGEGSIATKKRTFGTLPRNHWIASVIEQWFTRRLPIIIISATIFALVHHMSGIALHESEQGF